MPTAAALVPSIPAESKRTAPGSSHREIARHLAILALFLVLSLIMLDPLPRLAATHLYDTGDPLEWSWVLGFGARQLIADPLHLFDGNILYPFRESLAFGESTLTNVLLAAPIIWATDNAVLAQNYLVVLSFVLAGYGTYLLVKDLTGSAAAGVVAGVVFAFCPYRLEKLVHLPFLTAQWLPFILFALNRFLRGGRLRWAISFGGFLLLQFLTAFTLAYVTTFAVAAYLLALTVARPRETLRLRTLLPLTLAVAVAGGALLLASGPYFDVSTRYGMVRDIKDVVGWSANPTSYIAPNDFNRTWGKIESLVALGSGERHIFVGLLASFLALGGLVFGRPRRFAFAALFAGLVCFVLSLGPAPRPLPPTDALLPMPYLFLFDHFPGFRSMRVPARFAVGVMVALATLAGLGAARFLDWLSAANAARRFTLAAILAGVVLVEFAGFPLQTRAVPTGDAIPEVYQWLRVQPEKGTLIEMPISDKSAGQDFVTYYAGYHGWRVVNGWRSFFPPGFQEMLAVEKEFPSDLSLQLLADLQLRYVVVHEGWYAPAELPDVRARLAASADKVRLVRRFAGDAVYELTLPPARPPLRIDLVAGCEARAGAEFPVHLVYRTPGASVVALANPPPELRLTANWRASDGRSFRREVTIEAPDRLLRADRSQLALIPTPTEAGLWTLDVAVAPALAPDLPTLAPLVVAVRPASEQVDSVAPRLVAARLLDRSASPTSPPRVELSWETTCPCDCLAHVTVNVFDDQSRVWSDGNRTDAPARARSGDPACFGRSATETREVVLRGDSLGGNYRSEVVLHDPASGERREFVAPDGRLVTRFDLGRLRVANAAHGRHLRAAPEHPGGATFGGTIALVGWSLDGALVADGTLDVALHWKSLAPQPANYSVFVHVYDAAGKLVAQNDSGPAGGAWQTTTWEPGEALVDEHAVTLPPDLKPGEYALAVGVYDPATGLRRPIAGGADLGDDRLPLTRLTLSGR